MNLKRSIKLQKTCRTKAHILCSEESAKTMKKPKTTLKIWLNKHLYCSWPLEKKLGFKRAYGELQKELKEKYDVLWYCIWPVFLLLFFFWWFSSHHHGWRPDPAPFFRGSTRCCRKTIEKRARQLRTTKLRYIKQLAEHLLGLELSETIRDAENGPENE